MWGGSDDPADSSKNLRIPGAPGSDERVLLKSGRTVDEGAPVRAVAVHMCCPDTPFYRVAKSFYIFFFSWNSLSRLIFHLGK